MVTAQAALAAAATLVALAFAASTFERWLDRRRRHELAWTISLVMFAVASGALWLGVSTGWNLPTFRVFFLFGAILNVPWLAVGTVYLLGGLRTGDRTAAVVALLSAMATGVMVSAPSVGPLPATGLPQGKEVFGILPRVLAAVGSGVGAVVVIGGAVWSAFRLARGRRRPGTTMSVEHPGRLVLGNVLIATGTLILGASGTLQGRLGKEESFAVTLTLGIVVLFAGFLVATATGIRSPATAVRAEASAKEAPQQLPAEALR